MFGLKHVKWHTIVLLGICVVLLAWARDANAATKPCKLGDMCVMLKTSHKEARSGQVVTFTVTLDNKMNSEAKNLTVSYVLPRQVIIRSTSIAPRKGASDALQWRVNSLFPGATWTVKVRAEVLSYAPKSVSNTATVFVGQDRWLKSSLTWKIADSRNVSSR